MQSRIITLFTHDDISCVRYAKTFHASEWHDSQSEAAELTEALAGLRHMTYELARCGGDLQSSQANSVIVWQ